MVENAERLNRSIESKEARIGVIGLGYVGLPLALAFTDRGFRVLGFDVDSRKVEQLDRGASYIPHMDAQRIRNGFVRRALVPGLPDHTPPEGVQEPVGTMP